jgi:hypothetical protein
MPTALYRKNDNKIMGSFSKYISSSPIVLGSGHYLWRGVAPKRKGLGEQNVEQVKGWVNEKQNNSRVGY